MLWMITYFNHALSYILWGFLYFLNSYLCFVFKDQTDHMLDYYVKWLDLYSQLIEYHAYMSWLKMLWLFDPFLEIEKCMKLS